ncbi:MAG: FAD-dependent monooxygenase, partial [Nannocystaceae bacterium]
PFVNEVIAATDTVMRHDLFDLTGVSQWAKGNTLLVGDAAHAMTPNMGQGAAQGIEDAWSIVHLLDKFADPQEAFSAFEQARFAKATQVRQLSWRIGQVTNPHNPLVCYLRNLLLRLTPKFVATRQRARLFSVPSYR